MIKLIAAAIPKCGLTQSSESLLWFVKSFDIRVDSVDELNSFIVENLAEIQYYIYANIEVCNNYKKYNTNVMVKKKFYIYNNKFFTGVIKVYTHNKGYWLHSGGE